MKSSIENDKTFSFEWENEDLAGTGKVIMVMSFLDAIFTLMHVSNGAMEANPVMDYFLTMGWVPFILAKMGLTLIGVSTLYVYNKDKIMNVMEYCYYVLILYHMILVFIYM